MKQKWPILIFSALLTAFIVLVGIWGNAQFEHLHSGSVLTAQHAVQGIALDGWRQEAPGQWHFTFTVGEDIPSLTLCVTNTAVPLAPESLTSLERSGELYALDVTPGETVELVFTCGRSPQTWLMTSAFASRAFRFRTMTQLIALTAFVTMGMVLLALYHYKHLPELGYFLLYLVIMSAWALMVFFFPAIRNRLLQRILRSFFSLTVLASALLAAGLLGVKLPRSGRGLLALAAGCVVFFALSMSSYPPLRVGMLVAGMCLCLYYLMAAVNADYEGAALMLLPGAVTTGFRVWALMPGLDSVLFVESVPFYLLRCARLYDLPFAIGCMVFVCRRFALLFDRTEQLARELDARVAERTKELTAETEARKSMMLNIFHDLRSPLFAVSGGLETKTAPPSTKKPPPSAPPAGARPTRRTSNSMSAPTRLCLSGATACGYSKLSRTLSPTPSTILPPGAVSMWTAAPRTKRPVSAYRTPAAASRRKTGALSLTDTSIPPPTKSTTPPASA